MLLELEHPPNKVGRWQGRSSRARFDDPAPLWSLIIPTYGRPDSIRATVEHCLGLEPPAGRFEIVVVDDGGGIELGWLETLSMVRILRRPNGGPAAARNTGAEGARGRWLAFTDDDCRPRPDWLPRLAAVLAAHPDDMVGGWTVNALHTNVFSAASQDVVDRLYELENQDPDDAGFFTSNNIALSRSGFDAIGGFDANYPIAGGEDRAFCVDWRDAGRRLRLVPDAVVEHYHALDLASFWRQHVRYGRGAHRLFQEARRGGAATASLQLRSAPFHERAARTLGLVARPLRSRHEAKRWRRTAALALSQVATVAGFLQEQRARDPTSCRRP